jgi:hypothetical protein
MMCEMVFGILRIVEVLTRERRKSFAVIRKLFGGFQKEFWSNIKLNNKVIDIN